MEVPGQHAARVSEAGVRQGRVFMLIPSIVGRIIRPTSA
jgi:hypothetical protein